MEHRLLRRWLVIDDYIRQQASPLFYSSGTTGEACQVSVITTPP
jgi:hypothetical protein